ncbi:MAG TPA: Tad domain-containing protein, partial [Roseomonas sp.]|nr:Tad domain-containing protein [Roseomonas sp.]
MTMKLNRRGAIAAVSAVVMVPVIGFAGLAIDLTRIWLLNARLKTAVDAASLVAARTMTSATRDADTRALFWANFNQNGWSRSYLGSTMANAQPVIQQVSDTRIRVTATATIGTTLFGLINRSDTLVRETTLAEREGTGLELAIVLDQTSSMRDTAPGFASKLAAAQSAV